ncbi:MAG: aminotransferase class IV [Nitrospinales bacterium]
MAHAKISVNDHGFLFGDSVYEVVATQQGKTLFLEEHLARLRRSAKGISLDIPYSDERFISEINNTLMEAGNDESYIRIMVTRGDGEIDIDPSTCEKPNVLIFVTSPHIYPRENYVNGINVALVSIKRNSRDALNPGIKTGNYLNNVLAILEANGSKAHDALMLNAWGYLTECTTSNFFFVQDGKIMTPSEECGILSGITRSVIIQLARENGFLVEEGQWPAEILQKIDEAFITGTVKRVAPVTQLDGRPVGEGSPGPVVKKLMHLYDDFCENLVK